MDSLNMLTQTKVQTKEPVFTAVSRQDTKQQGTSVPTQEMEQEKKGVTGTDLFPPTQMRSLSGDPPPAPPVPVVAPMLAVQGPSLIMNPLTQAERRETRSDVERMGLKHSLRENIIANLVQMKPSNDPASLFRTLQKLVEYLGMDVTAQSNQKERNREAALLGEVIANLERIKGNLTGQEKMTAEFYLEYLKNETNGNLKMPVSGIEDYTAANIAAQVKFPGTTIMAKFAYKRNEPLFPHEPSISDIAQGNLGDCYLLSALTSIIHNHPEKIKECMRDNGDGTVIVRFYNFDRAGNRSENYIKVKKEVPVYDTVDGRTVDAYAQGSLWVQMIERAYAVSGMHLYKPPQDREYQDIAGGFSAAFVEKITGQRAEWIIVESEVEKAGADVVMEPIKEEAMLREFTGWPPKLQESAFIGRRVVSTVVVLTKQQIAKAVQEIKRSLLAGEFHTDVDRDSADLLSTRFRERINALDPNLFPISTNVPPEIRMTQGEVDTLKNSLAGWLISRIEALPSWKNLRTGSLFGDHSKYSRNADELFTKIQGYTRHGAYLSAGTRKDVQGMRGGSYVHITSGGAGKSAGEPLADGLAGSHAYTVIGVEQKGNVKYIKLKNPWASFTRMYLQGPDGNISTQVENEENGDTGGIWLVELGDFVHNFSLVEVNR